MIDFGDCTKVSEETVAERLREAGWECEKMPADEIFYDHLGFMVVRRGGKVFFRSNSTWSAPLNVNTGVPILMSAIKEAVCSARKYRKEQR